MAALHFKQTVTSSVCRYAFLSLLVIDIYHLFLCAAAEFNAPFFLDCCGLIRKVLRDLKEDFGFEIGSWNQAYMVRQLSIVFLVETTTTKNWDSPGWVLISIRVVLAFCSLIHFLLMFRRQTTCSLEIWCLFQEYTTIQNVRIKIKLHSCWKSNKI